MSKQPTGGKNAIKYRDKYYRLDRCLPGQQTAAKLWFELFNATVRALGGVADVMQPTLFKLKDLLISVHVDDLFLLGSKTAMDNFFDYLETKAGWKMDIEGPFKNIDDEFMYLKRKYSITHDGIIVRP